MCKPAVFLERWIANDQWSSVWKGMTPQEREGVRSQIIESARSTVQQSNLKGVAVTGAGCLAAKPSGFSVYMLASSALGGLTAELGITLPFGVYIAMSSSLAIILGPAGFIGLGLLLLHKITGPEHEEMIRAVFAIWLIRSRIEMERRWIRWGVPVAVIAAILALCIFLWLLFAG